MVKVNVRELVGPALDWAVAMCEPNPEDVTYKNGVVRRSPVQYAYTPSTDPIKAYPLITRELISSTAHFHCATMEHQNGYWYWQASMPSEDGGVEESYNGSTPLIAAMRCFVARHRGDEIEIPDELFNQS